MISEVLSGNRSTKQDPRAKMGRYGDSNMSHTEDGEMIIPRRILENNPSLMKALIGEFKEAGLNPMEFMVGSEDAKINPETGEEEFFDPMTMMLVGGGIGLGKSLLDSRGMDKALASSQAGYEKAQGMLSPYSDIGLKGMQDYASRISAGFSPEQYRDEEGYQFALDEGQKAIGNKLASMGMSQSGKAAKEAARFAEGLAAQDYQNAFNRYLADNQQFAALGNMGLKSALGIGDLYGRMGETAAEAQMAKMSGQNQLLGGLLNLGGALFGG